MEGAEYLLPEDRVNRGKRMRHLGKLALNLGLIPDPNLQKITERPSQHVKEKFKPKTELSY
jgi:hypothetical protein